MRFGMLEFSSLPEPLFLFRGKRISFLGSFSLRSLRILGELGG
jgi:hypothetical protein